MRIGLSLLLGSSALFVSCASLTGVRTIYPKKGQKGVTDSLSSANATAQLKEEERRSKEADQGYQVGLAPEEVGALPSEVDGNMTVGGYQLPSDSDIVWSTDDPEADIAFDKPFIKPVKSGAAWYTSYTNARRESLRTGKPVVMWFTNEGSSPSPICKTLYGEVFGKNDFGIWAKKNVIRLKIDMSGGSGARGELGDSVTRKRRYVAKLKKKYSVMGYPTVVMMEPNGSVYARYRGYKKGHRINYFDQMKDAVLTMNHDQRIWREKMAKKGYRSWKGKNDQIIFARLTSYKDGNLVLVEPNGTRIRTSENQMSKSDRDWLDAEKSKRGI